MATPSDLAAHYSELAYKTRIAALAFVGAALGAEAAWKDSRISSAILGFALLVIVFSLAELNRRYTWSYLSACRAAWTEPSGRQWIDFVHMNEGPWAATRTDTQDLALSKWKRAKRWLGRLLPRAGRFVSRFLLSWSTYVPGVLAGVYLVRRGGTVFERRSALAAGVILLGWWIFQTARRKNPADFLPEGH